ncbi:MAG: MFS transporter [Euryarchaeota archaeon]|nr:MFS transporter [Euryarchaeota archaeon]MDE1835640.1 MFS transporter [Euryarchaeota archaeon]MDE1878988.1 MFS transporter [Euryarchaeota archaeon]MDE2043738.1 MFS transporter [Thermoplasmata archaeon]
MSPTDGVAERTRGPFRRIAYVLAVTAFGAGVPTPLYSIYQREYAFSSTVLAAIFASYTVGVLLTMFLLAPQADLVGTRPILYVGMLLTVLSGVLFLLANGVLALAAARFVSGLAVGATTGTATVSMTHREPHLDKHHVARVAVGANFGAVATGILVSSLSVAYLPDPRQLVYVFLVASALLGLLAIRVTPPHYHPGPGATRLRIRHISVPRSIRAPFWISAGGVAACYAIYGFFASLAPAAVREATGIAPFEASAFVSVMFAGAAIVQIFLGQVRDRDALLLGLPMLALSLLLFVLSLPLASLPVLLGSGVLMGVAVGYVYMGAVTLVDRVAPDAVGGEVLSGFFLTGYLSLAVPTLGTAFLADHVGAAASGTAFGLALGVFVLLTYLATRRTSLPPGGEGRPHEQQKARPFVHF